MPQQHLEYQTPDTAKAASAAKLSRFFSLADKWFIIVVLLTLAGLFISFFILARHVEKLGPWPD